jgi:predicted lipase
MYFQLSFVLSLLFVSVITKTSPIEKYIKLTKSVSKATYLPLKGRRFLQNGRIIENHSTMKPNIFSSYDSSQDKISCSVGGWNAQSYENHGTEVILFTHQQLKLAVFGFRGTEPTSVKDWLKNFLISLTPVHIGSTRFHIHKGFSNRYHDISSWFEVEYKAISQDYTIVITGHSLGGALTTIAAVHASDKLNRRPDAVITFGSPLVGKQDFRNYYHKVVGCDRTLRIAVNGDFITTVPPREFGYTHVCSAFKVKGSSGWFSKLKLVVNHDLYGNYDRGLAKIYTANKNKINFGCDRLT